MSNCPPTERALDCICRYATTVVEIGAGDGQWAAELRKRGITVHAFDTHPKGESVEVGNEVKAAQYGDVLLAVWPPDGVETITSWITVKQWKIIMICADFSRLVIDPTLLDQYRLIDSVDLPRHRITDFRMKTASSTLQIWTLLS